MTKKTQSILEKYKRVAVYGMSKDPEKAAHRVPAYLLSQGFDVSPVNPSAASILERKCYDSLKAVEGHIDIVNVFRPSKEAVNIVKEAMARRKEKGDIAVIWLQEGIKNGEAKNLAEKNGIIFVQDTCMLKEHKRLFSGGG